MFKLSYLILLLALAACNGSGEGIECAQGTECTTQPVDTNPVDDSTDQKGQDDASNDARLPTKAFTFDANISFFNFTTAQEAKYQKAIELVKEVVATESFRSKVINHTYNGKKTFVDNNGLTNEQIYQRILDAAETLQPAKNNTMDLEVELYYAATSTVGYTYANSRRIWVNTKYFNSYDIPQVANNLFHEWVHKLGFGHAATYSTSRDYSVPYAIGDIVESVGRKL